MNISPLNVISWVHHQRNATAKVPYTVPTLQLHDNGNDAHYLMVNGNEAAAMAGFKPDEKFMYTKCLSSQKHSVRACSTEAQQLVQLALNGFNTSLMMLSVGAADSYKLRKDMLYQLINLLDVELCKLNIERKRRKQGVIQLEYAYIGVVDNFCYDLREGRRIENAEILNKGLEPLMRRVKQADKIWEKVRTGSSIPFILQLRLTDEAKFLGNLMVADLLHPEFQKPIVVKPASSVYYSFTQLRRTVVRAVNNSDFSKPFSLDLNTSVLTRLLAEYLVGLGRTVVVVHVNESLYHNMEETLHALRFAQFLQTIQCLVVPNKADFRVQYYRLCLLEIILKYKSDKKEYIKCKEKLKQRQDELQQLAQQMEEQEKTIERLTLECSVLRQQQETPLERYSAPKQQLLVKEEEKDELEEERKLLKEQDDRPHDDTNTINVVHEKPDDPVATTIDQLYRKYRASAASYKAVKHEDELRRLRIELLGIEGCNPGLKRTIRVETQNDALVHDDDQKNVPIPLGDYDTRPVPLSPEETQSICNEMNRVLTSHIQESERAQEEYQSNIKKLEIELDKSRREAKHYKELSLERENMQKKLQEQDQRSRSLSDELKALKEQLVLCDREISKQKEQAAEAHWKEEIKWNNPLYEPSSLRGYIDKVHEEHVPPDEDDEMDQSEPPSRGPFALKNGRLVYDLDDDEDIVMQSSSVAASQPPLLSIQNPSSQRTPPPSVDPRTFKRTKLTEDTVKNRGPRVNVYVDTRSEKSTTSRRKQQDEDEERTPLQVISENPQGPQKRRRVRSDKK